MLEETIDFLEGNNIPKDSDFYEYIGRTMDIEQILVRDMWKKDSYDKLPNILNELNKPIAKIQLINDLRLKYFETLLNSGEALSLSFGDMKNMTFAEASKKADEVAQLKTNELYELFKKDDFEGAKIVAKKLYKLLEQIYDIDLEVFNGVKKKIKDREMFVAPEPLPLSQYGSPYVGHILPQFQAAPTPTPTPPYTPTYTSTYAPMYTPPPAPVPEPQPQPVFKQSPRNYCSVRKRKLNSREAKRLLKGRAIKLMSVAATTATIAILLSSIGGKNAHGVKTTPMPTPAPTSTPISTPTPTYTPAPIEPTAYVSSETPTPAPKKGTLSYALQYMNDERISVVAESLRKSVNMLDDNHFEGYENLCSRTYPNDKEMLKAVFAQLDARALQVSSTSDGRFDKYGIAPQMRQLSGDLVKYLVARSIGESGKYRNSYYSTSNIQIYRKTENTTPRDVISRYAIRTVWVPEGSSKLEVDQAITDFSHNVEGDLLKPLVTAYCTLDNALNKTAIGTQEGCIIDTYSLMAYETICTILSNDLDITVNSPGKGLTIKAVDRNMDLDR